jgi:hypothetical protein
LGGETVQLRAGVQTGSMRESNETPAVKEAERRGISAVKAVYHLEQSQPGFRFRNGAKYAPYAAQETRPLRLGLVDLSLL